MKPAFPSTRPIPTALFHPQLLSGVSHERITLPDYDEPYEIMALRPDAPLARILAEHGVVRIPVPQTLRASTPLLAPVRTQVTRTLHSQTPHIDFPHPPDDPRRYNLFWAEAPRRGAATYFIPISHADALVEHLTAFLSGNAMVWAASQPVLARWAEDPTALSRYPLPAAMVEGYARLVRDGDRRGWARLSDFGKTTIAARVLGSTLAATRCVEAILTELADVAHVETWDRPLLVAADDLRFFHGRLGVGDSGGAFFRVWLSGPPGRGLSYLKPAPLAASA
ncbi:MAG: hypothetical protein ACI8S6_001423 [Myxococcota bacterium]|jgi:hypothetical protein